METMNKANREVCDVDIRELDGTPFLFFDTANTTTAGFTSDDTFASAKGAKRIAFSNPMEGTLSIEAQIAPFKLYALLSDGAIESTAVIAKKETIVCEKDSELNIPADAKNQFIYEEGQYGGTAIELSDVKEGKTYEVGYFIQKTEGVQRISLNNKKNPKDYIVTMNTVEKDEEGYVTPYILTFYKAKPKKTMELTFSSEGDPATVKIEFSALQNKDGNILDMVELTDDGDSLA